MNYREKIRKAVSSPYDGSATHYGEWGALRPDQRAFILKLLDEMDSADSYIKTLYQENQQLKEKYNKLSNNYERMYNCNCILRENRDKAIEYIEYCKTSKNDIFPIIEEAKIKEILKGIEKENK